MTGRRVGLTTKAVVALLAIAVLPLVVSAVLVQHVAVIAQSVAVGEAERLHGAVERARGAYVEALEARKAAFQRAADALAARSALRDACRGGGPVDLTPLLADEPGLVEATLVGPAGTLATVARPDGAPAGLPLHVERALAETPACRLALTFVTERGARLADDYRELGRILAEHRHLERIRRELPPTYRTAFVLLVGGVALAATAVAIAFARRTTRRIARLVEATRRVGEGNLDVRVALDGRDELADLARSFDDMVADLQRSRAEIEYLQKIGAWQEIARRLAHEIKNPLTPIQLAIQQLHTQYRGDDVAYRRTLDEAREIVGEEIAGLRRLVDAFSAFAKLPPVEPSPLDLATLVEDVRRDVAAADEPALALEVAAPPTPVVVSGDRLLLRRVLSNLVENAGQAGARRVRIAWRCVAGRAALEVEDDGPGVPAEHAGRLFDPYFTTKPHGTGLGLAIAKKTVLEHGGAIALTPRGALGGARFAITLPLTEAAPTGGRTGPTTSTAGARGGGNPGSAR